MFLARIDGTMTSTVKHPTLENARFLIAQRLDYEGGDTGEPIIVVDNIGARRGTTVLVSTDGDILRKKRGNTIPARLVVVGIVDAVGGRPTT
jgi:ethanolamine utilization protein EutN